MRLHGRLAEYEPFGADFQNSAELFAEGMEILWRAWTETGKWSHEGKYYTFRDIEIRRDAHGKPLVVFHGKALVRARLLKMLTAEVTITHGRDIAAAVVAIVTSTSAHRD